MPETPAASSCLVGPGLPGEGHFVGRLRELRLLGHLLAQARAGHGQAVAVAGAAGIGKTRLAQEVAALAQGSGLVVRWGRCLEEIGAPPFWPWRQLIRDELRTMTDDALLRQDRAGLALVATIVPELAARPGLQPPGTAAAVAGDDAHQRFALYDAVASFWRSVARDRPCLLVLDDMHRADPGSLHMLEFLATESAAAPLLILLTCRDDEAAAIAPLRDTLAELARLSHFRRLRLAGLSADETAAFVLQAGLPDAELAEAIHGRTEGHPLYLVETVRLLAQDHRRGAGPPDARQQASALQGVPDGVRDVIARRLGRLRPGTGRVLVAASGIGRSFDVGLLAQLVLETPESVLDEALDEAVAARLIEALPRSGRYRFVHMLVRDTLYGQLAPVRRARLHRRIGELLEARADVDPGRHLAQLAHHFHEAGAAGDTDKALAYAQRAARHAALALAHEDAAQLYRQALSLLPDRQGDRSALRVDLLLALGDVALAMGNGRAGAIAYLEVAALAPAVDGGATLARAAIGFEKAGVIAADSGEQAVHLLQQALCADGLEATQRVQLLAGLCRALLYSHRQAEAAVVHPQAVAAARALGDPAALYAALASFASAVFVPALLPRALQGSIEAWQVLAQAGRLVEAAPENNAWLLVGLLRTGQTAALQDRVATMQTLARQARSPYHQAIVSCMAVQLALAQGDFTQAEASAQQAFAAGRRASAPQAASVFGMHMFCIRREQGRLGEVQPLLQQMLQSPSDSHSHEAFWLPGLALLQAELGQREASQASYDRLPWQHMTRLDGDARTQILLAFAAETCGLLDDTVHAAPLLALLTPLAGSHLVADLAGPYLGSADRLLGRLATVCGDWARAEQHFDAALAEDERSGGRVWLAHGRCQYAQMLLRRGAAGDGGRAQALLKGALQNSLVLGMAALQTRVQACLQAQASALAIPASVAMPPFGLTLREVEVLQLAAIGRSNRDIALALAISANTVANHMRSILEKTYTANRTEAAAFARQNGLVRA